MEISKKMMALLATNGPISDEQISRLTEAQISWLTGAQISRLTEAQISRLTEAQISWLTEAQISWLTGAQISRLTEAQISRLTEAQISWLTEAQISRLTGAQKGVVDWLKTFKIANPYSQILSDIKAGKRKHDQKTFGPESIMPSEGNLCRTPMCIAGHLVNLAGEEGWKLKERFGFTGAAFIIHSQSRPDVSAPRFDTYPNEWAMAYIEERAKEEKK